MEEVASRLVLDKAPTLSRVKGFHLSYETARRGGTKHPDSFGAVWVRGNLYLDGLPHDGRRLLGHRPVKHIDVEVHLGIL